MEQLKVLFVDDDLNLGSFVTTILETDYNYKVHFQNTLLGIDSIVQTLMPDIIILDVEIGKENGMDKAQDIIAKYPQIPLLFVSSHTEDDFITKGISIGGNAYLPKPLSIPVLVSYIQRFALKTSLPQIIELANYQLNLRTNEFFYKKQLIKKLSPFEKNALAVLMEHPNEIVTKEQLAEKLWNHSLETHNSASLNNILSKLRDLFKDNSSLKIRNIRGVGYMMNS
ncbi:response regulator [Labilibaculum sp. A4]|uniref:response regulator transcription factor n=1 Tax=Labilibaculum euxinus TaxID=2686357 RepID=UPI000F623AC2|nr:response regulator transcription factor [Labilibaculum euxinus]MDQ1769530.1 response regulator transcription factor [Labilibaculum euxinus]MWN75055.1 response regulator [Labilibaculum euxinus]